MWVCVWDNLPVHPRNSRLADLVCVLLDIRISRRSRERRTAVADVVGGVEVAHPPFLHYQLFAGFLRFLDVGREDVFGQVTDAVGVDCDHVERCAGEVGVGRGGGEVGGSAGGDEDVGAGLEVGLDCAGDGALPFCEGVGVFLWIVSSCSWKLLFWYGDCLFATYVVVHSFVLRLERKDILWALRPRLAVVRVDVRHHVRDAVLVVADCFRVAVEVVDAVRLPVEVSLAFERVVAVEGDDEFDAVASRVEHEVVEAVEDFVVPGLGGVAFEAGVAGYLGAFLGGGLAWSMSG